jgi:hypothetical protein
VPGEEVRDRSVPGRSRDDGKELTVTIEYVGAIDLDPPLAAPDVCWLADGSATGWLASRDGSRIRPRRGTPLAICVQGVRDMVALDDGVREYDGVVAVYDDRSGELFTITARDGRVRRRTVRRPRVRERSNVVDLATRRRAYSRVLEEPG